MYTIKARIKEAHTCIIAALQSSNTWRPPFLTRGKEGGKQKGLDFARYHYIST